MYNTVLYYPSGDGSAGKKTEMRRRVTDQICGLHMHTCTIHGSPLLLFLFLVHTAVACISVLNKILRFLLFFLRLDSDRRGACINEDLGNSKEFTSWRAKGTISQIHK